MSNAKKSTDERKIELAHFLTARRAKVKPSTPGEVRSRRRTPGLRREEVAEMAGISLSWYTWLEQGRDVQPSSELLQRLAQILKLNRSETKHLFDLADRMIPEGTLEVKPEFPQALENFVTKTLKVPAFVLNERFEFVLWNNEFKKRFYDVGQYPADRRSWLEFIFMDEKKNGENPNWREVCRRCVAEFRMGVGKQIGSAWVKSLVERLQQSSPLFTKLWKDYEVRERANTTLAYQHAEFGTQTYERSVYMPLEAENLRVVVLNPAE